MQSCVPARLVSPREHGQRETGSKMTQLGQGWVQCAEGGCGELSEFVLGCSVCDLLEVKGCVAVGERNKRSGVKSIGQRSLLAVRKKGKYLGISDVADGKVTG